MDDNLEIEKTSSIKDKDISQEPKIEMKQEEQKEKKSFSIKTFLSLLYKIIEPYYDLLVINKKFRWLMLR